ncbi:hypothetical protein BDB00DRAFT_831769 [Zychaea mexicana]|uniref:uncharacterized protein n=1 Tax=Zychaea mexicana TaxID=64656 RepID=UPI0022FEE154|nr:uncharacterized protein BDB00DRAFT_831769 [Zychaea mexicana]KAI9491701.1 hypothetical protein BDB00DRAFT_831769 [Zychaea mexicana]
MVWTFSFKKVINTRIFGPCFSGSAHIVSAAMFVKHCSAVNQRHKSPRWRIVRFIKQQMTWGFKSRSISSSSVVVRLKRMTARKHPKQEQQEQQQGNTQMSLLSLTIPFTLNINGGALTTTTLKTYQINATLVCAFAFVPLLFFAFYQCGRVIGLLEVVFFGVDDILRTTFSSLTRIFTRTFFS